MQNANASLDFGHAFKNATVSFTCSILGSGLGSLTSYGQAAQGNVLLSKGQDKLLTGVIHREVGQSSSSLLKQGAKLVSKGHRYINLGRGISSVTGSVLTWGVSVKYSVN